MILFYSVGAEADDDRIELLLREVKGKDITELIAAGREKLASVPSGGGGAVAVAATGGGGAAPAAAAAAAEPKKEEKVEEKEESDDVSFYKFDFDHNPVFVFSFSDDVSFYKLTLIITQFLCHGSVP